LAARGKRPCLRKMMTGDDGGGEKQGTKEKPRISGGGVKCKTKGKGKDFVEKKRAKTAEAWGRLDEKKSQKKRTRIRGGQCGLFADQPDALGAGGGTQQKKMSRKGGAETRQSVQKAR